MRFVENKQKHSRLLCYFALLVIIIDFIMILNYNEIVIQGEDMKKKIITFGVYLGIPISQDV